MADPWMITYEERAKQDAQFASIAGGSPFVTGDQARGFFMQSGLPSMVLGQIWGMADVTNDGKMDRKEFSIAMTLVKRKLQGYNLPPTLPPSMLVEPTGAGMSATLPARMNVNAMTAMGSMTLPGGQAPSSPSRSRSNSQNIDWGVPQPSRLKYNHMFNKEDRRRTGFLSGLEARQLLMSTGLPQNLLAQIWALSDVDQDGKLSGEEFCVAMHLADMVRMNQMLPMVLPPNLIPPSLRKNTAGGFNTGVGFSGTQTLPSGMSKPPDSFGDLIPSGFSGPQANEPQIEEPVIQPLGPQSIEDKRRENFARGNAELERRRAELREQQRKEEEARLAKERAEQEKKEAARREQERKKQLEHEKILERQRQLEAERDEQRRKALEAREEARLDMERQRQREWENQRKMQLLAEKNRQQESTELLQTQVNNLKYEIETMDNKKVDLTSKIAESKQGIVKLTQVIDGMRFSRDNILRAIENHDVRKNDEERRYKELCDEHNRVNYALQMKVTSTPLSDTYKSAQSSLTNKKVIVDQLKKELQEYNTSEEAVKLDSDTTNSLLKKLQESIGELKKSQNKLRTELTTRKSDWEKEKNRRDAEIKRAAEEKKMEEEAVKRKEEEEKKKEADDKWSVFKDLNVGKPAPAPASTPFWNTDTSTSQQSPFEESTNQKSPFGAVDTSTNHSSAFGHISETKKSDPFGSTADPFKEAGFAASFTSNKDAFPSTIGSTIGSTTSSDLAWDSTTTNDGWFKPEQNATPAVTHIAWPAADTKPDPTQDKPASKQTTFGAHMMSEPAAEEPKNRKLHIYEAQFDFEARNEDELTFNADDKIKVYPDEQGTVDNDWLYGWKGDQAGLFPANYVEKDGEIFEPVTVQKPKVATIARSESAFGEVVAPDPPESETSKPAPSGLKCRAINPWRAKKNNHLTFDKGAVITVVMQQDHWWQGRLDSGQEGWFPKSYVEQISHSQPSAAAAPMYDKVPTEALQSPKTESAGAVLAPMYDEVPKEEALQKLPEQKMKQAGENLGQCVSIHAFESGVDGDLNFATGEIIAVLTKDGEWWQGQIGARRGIFPANFVKDCPPKSPVLKSSPAHLAPVAPSAPKEIGKVLAAYDAMGAEQLSLKPNQLVTIIKKSASGWWQGELVAKGLKKQIGWFPKDYVNLLPPKGGGKDRDSVSSIERSTTPTNKPVSPQPKPATPVPIIKPAAELVEAAYLYTAQNSDELSFNEGDIITILSKEEADWWKGELNGQTGLLPVNYVQPYQQPLSEVEKQRQLAIQELMNTEETYVNDMVIALEAFYKPLKENKVMPDEELDAIFVNWKELIHCNRKLVKAMKVRKTLCGENQPISIVGDILIENFPNMTPYIRFCSRQLYAAQVLQKRLENDANAKAFVSKCQQDSRVMGMPLSSYIIKPMQRITKYPLLIKRVAKHTPETHADYQYINEAVIKADELAAQVNEGVREKDNSDKLEWVQNAVSCEGLSENITFNSLTNSLGQRKFIYSGVLTKGRSGRELYAFLFNDFLLLTTVTSDKSLEKVFHLDAKGIIFRMYKTPIFLNEMTARIPVGLERPDTEDVCFQICHIENVIDIKCSSTTERDAWLKRLQAGSESALSMEKVKRDRAMSIENKAINDGQRVGRLLVILVEGNRLLASDANGKSDPYCEVSMGSTIQKTKVIPNTLNPKWNSSMQFPIKSMEDDVLCLTVFDQDRFSPNDFLGRTELRIKDIFKEAREKKGPILKRAKLHEVNTGNIVVKLDIQLYPQNSGPIPSSRAL